MISCTVWWARPLPLARGFLDLLEPDETARAEAYRQHIDSRRFVTGRVVAKSVVAESLGLPVREVAFDATCADCGRPHGPPRVPSASLALSISHSGDRVGVAVTGGAPVGLDVEATARGAGESLIEYALNGTERAAVQRLSERERADAFFVYWTRKEALMKATGHGLKLPLRDLTVSGYQEPPRLVASADTRLNPATTRVVDLDPGDGYRAAAAALTDDELALTQHWWHP